MMRPRPRVLHLYSDWRWTAAAESIVNLCRHLRRLGFPVDLACRRPPGNYPQSLEHRARERRIEPILDFGLNGESRNPFDAWGDARALTEFIDREEVEIVHVHNSYDHYVGSRAARRVNSRPFVVRTNHSGQPLPSSLISRWLMRGHTDAWVAPTRPCLEQDMAHFGIRSGRGIAVEEAVDLARFSPRPQDPGLRKSAGLAAEHVVAGIVSRIAPGRGLEQLLPALAEALRQEPSLRVLVIGKESDPSVLRESAARLGIQEKLILCGYRGEDYPDYLRTIDFLVLPYGGCDGACRAAREAMARGKPLVAPRSGLLPELVEEERCGILAGSSVEEMSGAILRMARDGDLRKRLGQAASEKAHERFGVERQVEAVAELYLKLAEEG